MKQQLLCKLVLLISLRPVELFSPTSSPPSVVIIGGGWAGYGAAEGLARLCSEGKLNVTVLEAQPRGGGLAASWLTPGGRRVEAGIHGFWRNYRNIDQLVTSSLGLTGDASPFTDFCESTLFTRRGKAVVSPKLDTFPRLPAPLGTALLPEFGTVSIFDRSTAAALALPWLDFDGSDSAWRRYDDTTASSLLAPVSPQLYEEFLLPMLLVLPMAPGYDISAAAALSCFSFFALEHQSDFDVRWLKAGATECIFEPWRDKLEAQGVVIRDGTRVDKIQIADAGLGGASTADESLGRAEAVVTADGERIACDYLISGVNINAMKKIVEANPALATRAEFQKVKKLRAISVVAVRLWLSKPLSPKPATPSNVCGRGLTTELESIGWTFYHLNDLQDAFMSSSGGDPKEDCGSSVVECDFYNAISLMSLSDADIVDVAARALRRADPSVFGALGDYPGNEHNSGRHSNGKLFIEDFAVVKVREAVSHFSPGSFRSLPKIRSSSLRNFAFAGDWVDRGGHRSWSQEKALVTGFQAARIAVEALVGDTMQEKHVDEAEACLGHGALTRVDIEKVPLPLEVEDDEPHVALGRSAVRFLRGAFSRRA